MNVFNPAQFRAQFPALQDAGVYLDSAATALKPEAVVEATRQFYSLSAGNVHRSQFAEAQRLTARYVAAREKVAQDRKSTRLNSSHITRSRMPSSA